MNKTFFGNEVKRRVKPKDFSEWGRVGFVAIKRIKPKKIENKGAAMILVGCTLDRPSGSSKFFKSSTYSINISNSAQ